MKAWRSGGCVACRRGVSESGPAFPSAANPRSNVDAVVSPAGIHLGSLVQNARMQEHDSDVLILGAGAAGLFCAFNAGRRGLRVRVVECANKPGKKILMSGGGRCNFTNTGTAPEHF